MNNNGNQSNPNKENHSFSQPKNNASQRRNSPNNQRRNSHNNPGRKAVTNAHPALKAADKLKNKNNHKNNNLGKNKKNGTNNTSTSNNQNEEQQGVGSNPISEKAAVGAKVAKKAFIKILAAIVAKVVITAVIVLAPVLAVLAIFTAFIDIFKNGDYDESATAGYYPIKCEEVTVIFTDKSKNYEVTGSGTYSLEDYVAGVISGEVGEFNNIEVYKEYAILARTYFLKNENDCTIESSDRKQVFSTYSSDLAKQAAKETKGQVLLDVEGKLMMTEYDAFCSIAVDDNYYTIKQKNQKIPRSWVDNQHGILPAWKEGTCKGNHGRGASQWGSYYLATEMEYDYRKLLNYYFKDENSAISISSPSFITSIANLDIKETTNAANTLNQPIESLLASKGGSLADYNNYIKQSVNDAGYGTRAGVVAGAVAMINYLYDNFNTKLPYYWGGSYQEEGIPSSFGTNVPSSPSPSGTRYQYKSFDCSGFTSWAVKNAGFKINRLTASGFDNLVGSKNMCNITNSSCIGEPGDFISYKEQHIKMIVSVDEANNKYYVAESTGSGVIITTQGMHTEGSVETNILHMGEFYNNQNNINS